MPRVAASGDRAGDGGTVLARFTVRVTLVSDPATSGGVGIEVSVHGDCDV